MAEVTQADIQDLFSTAPTPSETKWKKGVRENQKLF